MAARERTISSGKDTCSVCHDDVEVYAIGECDHPICYKCATRMRVLCQQMYCAICRTDMSKIVFIKGVQKFQKISTQTFQVFRKYHIFFESRKIEDNFYDLISHKCKFCTRLKPFNKFHHLEQHMRRDHKLYYCDICVDHLRIFSWERKCYDRELLARHRRLGDEDDKSLKGHPLCELCDDRFLDRDELAKHCRKEHFRCHFCESDGRVLEFFGDYNILREHFRDEHFLCEEGSCIDVKFTNAFRSDIDFIAHKATVHSKGMKKSEARQARIIELDIHLAPRSAPRGRGKYQRRDRYDRDRDQERQQHTQEQDSGGTGPPGDDRGHRRPEDNRRNIVCQKREELETAQAVAASLNQIQRHSGSVSVLDAALIQSVNSDKAPEISKQPNDFATFEKRTSDFPTLGMIRVSSDPTLRSSGRVASKEKFESDEDSDSAKKREALDKDTLAKKLARANHFSVQDGSMEDKDFPSLRTDKNSKNGRVSSGTVWNSTLDQSDYPALPPKKVTTNNDYKPNKPNYPALPVTSKHPKPTAIDQSDYPSLASKKPKTSKPNGMSSPVSTSKTTVNVPAKAPTWVQPSSKTSNKKSAPQSVSAKSAVSASPKSNHKTAHEPFETSTSVHLSNILADFPSLSSIGNSLFESKCEEQAPKLSMFRSSQATASVTSGHKGPVTTSETAPTKQQVPPPRLGKDDFPSLGGVAQSKPQAQVGKWVQENKQSKPDKEKKEDTNQGKKTKKGKQSQEVISKKEPLVKVDTQNKTKVSVQEEPPVTKPKDSVTEILQKAADKPSEWQPVKAQKTRHAAVEEKQGREIETFVLKHIKSKKKKAKKQDKKPSKSDGDSDEEPLVNYSIPIESKSKPSNKLSEKAPPKPVRIKPAESSVEEKPALQPKVNNFVNLSDVSSSLFKTEVALQPKVNNFVNLSDVSSSLLNTEVAAPDKEDFPSPSSQSKPPPPGLGFQVSSGTTNINPPGVGATLPAPPPGFMKNITKLPPSLNKPPPGLGFSYNENIENIVPVMPNGTPSKPSVVSFSYIQPANSKDRNQSLIRDIQGRLSSQQFDGFKHWSGEFRQDRISGFEYYNKCCDIIGHGEFLAIFAELLVLLPDIDKQQELLTTHNNNVMKLPKTGKKGWKCNLLPVTACLTCQQVVMTTEMSSHTANHHLDKDFPALGISVNGLT